MVSDKYTNMQMGLAKMHFPAIVALLALLCCVSGRQFFRTLIPNGANPGLNCSHLGHKNCKMPTQLGQPNNNKFGLDFRAAGFNWTMELCMKDSDDDGLTNGEELGDPCCEWTKENQKLNRTENVSHPGDASKKATGNVKCSKEIASDTNTTNPSTNTNTTNSSTNTNTTNSSTTTNTTNPSTTTNTTNPSTTTNTTNPSPNTTSTNTTNSSAVCFPGDSQVALADGSIILMEKLTVGDLVEVAAGTFSPVFMFTHKIEDIQTEFVSISTRCGAQLHLSPGHFVYFNDKLAPAAEVLVGDHVEVDGGSDDVVAVARVVKKGLYNPQTVHGDIVVNRFRVSTFTESFRYGGAQAALMPFRALYSWCGVYFRAFESGVREAFLPRTEL